MAISEYVKEVIDGDTFDTKSYRVRLNDVDAPEKGQPGWDGATNYLKELIEGDFVTIFGKDFDKHGRLIAEVKHGNYSVNKAMKIKLNK